MYELGVGYDVSNTKAPELGLVVSAWWDPSLLKVSRLLFCFKTILEKYFLYINSSWNLLDRSKVRNKCQKKINFFFFSELCSTQQKSQEFNYFSAAVFFFCEMTAWNLLVLSQLLRKTQSQKTESQYCPTGGLRPNWELLIWTAPLCRVVLHDVSERRPAGGGAARAAQRAVCLVASERAQTQLCRHPALSAAPPESAGRR